MESKDIILLAQKVIRSSVGVGLEEAGTRICGPTAWNYVKAVLSPVVDKLQSSYPKLFLVPEEAEKAATALSADKVLCGMLSDGFARLENGQGEILTILAKIDSKLDDIAQQYMVTRGVIPYQDYLNGVLLPQDLSKQGTIDVDRLRKKLLQIDKFPSPVLVTVQGTLFPCALLVAGWWDRQEKNKIVEPTWHDDIQKWLFHGFDLWGPSWDFTWGDGQTLNNSYTIAQLGAGDESDSLPVLIPQEKASRLVAFFRENWGGGEVEVTGLLGHRSQFLSIHKDVELVGGLLDYCLWIDQDNKYHGISELNHQTDIYSGYLWKCVTPKVWYDKNENLSLNQVYFVWEHTNFRDIDAVNYNLDSLMHKEEYLTKKHGELMLLQKSSRLVPGTPIWNSDEFYNAFVNKKKRLV